MILTIAIPNIIINYLPLWMLLMLPISLLFAKYILIPLANKGEPYQTKLETFETKGSANHD